MCFLDSPLSISALKKKCYIFKSQCYNLVSDMHKDKAPNHHQCLCLQLHYCEPQTSHKIFSLYSGHES